MIEITPNKTFDRDNTDYYLSSQFISMDGLVINDIIVCPEQWQTMFVSQPHLLLAAAPIIRLPIQRIAQVQWTYDPQKQQLKNQATNTCLTGNDGSFKLSLTKCDDAAIQMYQKFIYKQDSKELFWINPVTQQNHVIYLKSDQFSEDASSPYKGEVQPFISRNSEFAVPIPDASSELLQNKKRLITLFALQKTGFKETDPQQIHSYWKRLESFNSRRFNYFMNKGGKYMLSDGNSLISEADLNDVDYKYYGLWYINEDNHLVHYLSGKHLVAIPIQDTIFPLIQPRIPNLANIKIDPNHCFDLKLAEYSSSDDTRKFVTVHKNSVEGERYEIYHHYNHYNPSRIQKMFILPKAELFLAFDDDEMAEKFVTDMMTAQCIK